MIYVVLLFGLLITISSVVVIVKPNYIYSVFTKYGDTLGLHVFAVIVRIILGVTLVIAASESKAPIIMEIIGWLLISAALLLSVIGRERFKGLIKWSVGISSITQRLMATVGILFGCFLIYVAV